jgi:hypothetical protein
MRRWACLLGRGDALVFTTVTAVTLTACSAAPGTTPTAEPAAVESTSWSDSYLTPSESVPPTVDPSATGRWQIAGNVDFWYEAGGEEQITGVREEAKEIYSHHAEDSWVIDFSMFFDYVDGALEYPPIPDRKTQAAWSTALKHIKYGGADVRGANQIGIVRNPEQVRREAHGWKELAKGIEGLDAVEARLHHTFGIGPLPSP